MMKKKWYLLPVLAAAIALFGSMVHSIYADPDTETIDTESVAQRVKEAYEAERENHGLQNNGEIEIDYANARAVGYWDAVDKYVRANPESELSNGFVAAWITKNNEFVMKLNCRDEGLEEFVREELKCTDTVFEYGEGNWLKAEQRYDEVGGQIYQFYENAHDCQDNEVKQLYNYFPNMHKDGTTGELSIILSVSDETAEYIREVFPENGLSHENMLELFGTVHRDSRYKEFAEGVELFRKLITEREDLLYTVEKLSRQEEIRG